MMLMKPETVLPVMRAGIMSRYVSVVLSSTLTAFSPASTEAKGLEGQGKSQVGHEINAVTFDQLLFDSLAHATDHSDDEFRQIFGALSAERCEVGQAGRLFFCSALSRIEHVLSNTASASSG